MISEFPLWVFTTLTGVAAGSYVIAALFPSEEEEKRPWLLPLVSLALIAVGSFGALGHLGRPELVLGVFNNPAASLTLEGICAGLMGLVAAVDLATALAKKRTLRAVRIVGLAAGCLLIAVESYAYLEVFGIPAWTGASTVALFVLSDVSAGACAWAFVSGRRFKGPFGIVALALLALAAIATIWKCLDYAALGAAGQELLVAGAVVTVAAAVAAGMGIAGKPKLSVRLVASAVLVLGVAGMMIARYGFYMASIL